MIVCLSARDRLDQLEAIRPPQRCCARRTTLIGRSMDARKRPAITADAGHWDPHRKRARYLRNTEMLLHGDALHRSMRLSEQGYLPYIHDRDRAPQGPARFRQADLIHFASSVQRRRVARLRRSALVLDLVLSALVSLGEGLRETGNASRLHIQEIAQTRHRQAHHALAVLEDKSEPFALRQSAQRSLRGHRSGRRFLCRTCFLTWRRF